MWKTRVSDCLSSSLDLTIVTTGGQPKDDEELVDGEDGTVAPAEVGTEIVAKVDAKRPAINQQQKEKTKQQANAVSKGFQPVVTQGLGRNAQSQEKLSVLVTLPANITDKSQLIIEFDEASNGSILVIEHGQGTARHGFHARLRQTRCTTIGATIGSQVDDAAQEPQH
jgi:hypothetical protein